MAKTAGMKLCFQRGHAHWAEWELRAAPSKTGWYMMVDCDLAEYRGHFLAPDPADPQATPSAGRVAHTMRPYEWPTARDAFAARDRYSAQGAQADD